MARFARYATKAVPHYSQFTWALAPYIMRCLLLIITLLPITALAETSICYGTTSNGKLENGVQLPGKEKTLKVIAY